MGEKYTVPVYNRLARPVLRYGFRALFHLLSRVKITGLENVPSRGPYLVAINHVSLYDPPFAASFWPTPVETIAAVEILSRPGQSLLFRSYYCIQVKRQQFDRQVIERAIKALEAGRPIMIAPEGGRSHTTGMRQAQPGIAYLAEKTGAPVIPVAILGSTEDFWKRAMLALPFRRKQGVDHPRPGIELRIGKPLLLPPVRGRGEERHAALQANADLIMRQIAALLPPEYHGVYAILD